MSTQSKAMPTIVGSLPRSVEFKFSVEARATMRANFVILLLSASFCASSAYANGKAAHENALIRMGKALHVEEGFSRGIEEGVARLMQNKPSIVARVLDCARENRLESKLLSEWLRIHQQYFSTGEAETIAEYFESTSGQKLILGIRACSTRNAAAKCDPFMTMSIAERKILADFEKTAAAATLNRAQSLAQSELKKASQVLVAKTADQCLRAAQ